jgi:SsrA-binding protein
MYNSMIMSHETTHSTDIAQNRKARHDYTIEQTFEAGIVLEGWEVKSLRAGKAQITDSYALIKKGEAWLLGAHITPLNTVAPHIHADPQRTRKLLLHQVEISKLVGAIERKGYTVITLKMYWKKNRAKILLGLAKGKKQFDKRAALKEKEWQRQKQRQFKTLVR